MGGVSRDDEREGRGEGVGEGVRVFAGVVGVHDLGPGCVVPQDDGLVPVVSAAAAGFGRFQGSELGCGRRRPGSCASRDPGPGTRRGRFRSG